MASGVVMLASCGTHCGIRPRHFRTPGTFGEPQVWWGLPQVPLKVCLRTPRLWRCAVLRMCERASKCAALCTLPLCLHELLVGMRGGSCAWCNVGASCEQEAARKERWEVFQTRIATGSATMQVRGRVGTDRCWAHVTCATGVHIVQGATWDKSPRAPYGNHFRGFVYQVRGSVAAW